MSVKFHTFGTFLMENDPPPQPLARRLGGPWSYHGNGWGEKFPCLYWTFEISPSTAWHCSDWTIQTHLHTSLETVLCWHVSIECLIFTACCLVCVPPVLMLKILHFGHTLHLWVQCDSHNCCFSVLSQQISFHIGITLCSLWGKNSLSLYNID